MWAKPVGRDWQAAENPWKIINCLIRIWSIDLRLISLWKCELIYAWWRWLMAFDVAINKADACRKIKYDRQLKGHKFRVDVNCWPSLNILVNSFHVISHSQHSPIASKNRFSCLNRWIGMRKFLVISGDCAKGINWFLSASDDELVMSCWWLSWATCGVARRSWWACRFQWE